MKSPQAPQTLKLTRTRGSESFITKYYRVYWASNFCTLGLYPVGLGIMGHSYLESYLDPQIRQVIEQSIPIQEALNAYLRFYASRLKDKINQQN